MPWRETDVAKERVKFVLEWERQWELTEGRVNMTALCAAFGVSRVTGYEWVRRYNEGRRNLEAVQERSRRPRTTPTATPTDIVAMVLAARRKFPKWGPRKLKDFLSKQHPKVVIPAASTIGSILQRQMLTRPRKHRRAKVPAYTRPFATCTEPNMVWCVDFKGHFRTKNGERVYPLTIMDAYSRFIIRCVGVRNPDGIEVKRVFESAFREYGRPAAIRSDNGPPFASKAAGGLSWLSAWWVCMGIVPERIEPGHPEQNGRHERMHRTLKEHTASPPAATPAAQQRSFDTFVKEYNYVRPHEALDMQTPSSFYHPSDRRYPIPWTSPSYKTVEQAVVRDDGTILFGPRRRVFIADCLALRTIGLDFVSYRLFEAVFGPVHLGFIDMDDLDAGLIRPGNRRYRSCEERKAMSQNLYMSSENMNRGFEVAQTGRHDDGFEGHRAGQDAAWRV